MQFSNCAALNLKVTLDFITLMESWAVCSRCLMEVPSINILLHSLHCGNSMSSVKGGRNSLKRPHSPEVVDLTGPSVDLTGSSSPQKAVRIDYPGFIPAIETSKEMAEAEKKSVDRLGIKWQPYYLLSLPGLSNECNNNAITLGDIISGEITQVLLMNYMIDFEWLLETCPKLKDSYIPVCLLHGEKGGQGDKLKFVGEHELYNWTCSEVDLGAERFGTHHSKAAVIFYPDGVRVAIMTANYIELDFLGKTQGVFVQDFPKKTVDMMKEGLACAFEDDLISYLEHVRLMSTSALTTFLGLVRQLRDYDFTSADVVIIASVPGRHTAKDAKWGHLKMSAVLRKTALGGATAIGGATASIATDGPPTLLMQFSSIGSIGEKGKYLSELADSLFEGQCRQLQLVWPTVQCVAHSIQGYMAGGSLPCNASTICEDSQRVLSTLKEGFTGNLYRWEGSPSERHVATPHMKCYFKYRIAEGKNYLDWFLLTSMNLSQAAWGLLQSNNTKLYIKSYELGVLLIPSRVRTLKRLYSCTPLHSVLGLDSPEAENILLASDRNFLGPSIRINIPFEVPPPRYSVVDEPWTWDTNHMKPDRFGNIFSRCGKY